MSRRWVALSSLLFLFGCPANNPPPSTPKVEGPGAASQDEHSGSATPNGQPSGTEAAPGIPAEHAVPTPPAQPSDSDALSPADAGSLGTVAPPLHGIVSLDPAVKKDAVKDSDVLFIIARLRAPAGQKGALVAVKRQVKPELPFKFELSQKDVMVPGMPFTGPFQITARLDHDGDALTKADDDLYAASLDASGGQDHLALVLKSGKPGE